MNPDKPHSVHLYLSQDQYARFRAAAVAYSQPLSTYIKHAAMKQYNIDMKEYARKLNAAKAELIEINYPGMGKDGEHTEMPQ